MIWDYLILGAILAWALYYLWRTFFRKRGCSCGGCPSGSKVRCPVSAAAESCDEYGPDGCKADEEPLR